MLDHAPVTFLSGSRSAADRAGASFYGVSVEKFLAMSPWEKAQAQRSKKPKVEMPFYTRKPPSSGLTAEKTKKKETVYTRIEKKLKNMKQTASKCRWHPESLALAMQRSNSKTHEQKAKETSALNVQ